jgi:hypothetical protein
MWDIRNYIVIHVLDGIPADAPATRQDYSIVVGLYGNIVSVGGHPTDVFHGCWNLSWSSIYCYKVVRNAYKCNATSPDLSCLCPSHKLTTMWFNDPWATYHILFHETSTVVLANARASTLICENVWKLKWWLSSCGLYLCNCWKLHVLI